jgi:hypothetical protein
VLANPSLESWFGASTPVTWLGDNVVRSTSARTGSYAAELGRISDRQAVLSQTVSAAPSRIYQIAFWAMAIPRSGRIANFTLEVQILVYDSANRLIGRVDPVYNPGSLSIGTYRSYSFTSGQLSPRATRMTLRFVFSPRTGNGTTVVIDDVSMICVR